MIAGQNVMFGSIRKQVDATISNDIETIIGHNTIIKGEIFGESNLRIDGNVEGGISTTGSVVIGESGVVKGDIKAANLSVSGQVTGNAEVTKVLAIDASGQLIGDVKVETFSITDGGIFKGRSEMAVKTVNAVTEE